MAVERMRMRFDVVQFERMVEAGVLTEADRVELVDGEIVEMAPIGDRHQSVVSRLTHLLVSGVGREAIVRIQGSVALPPRSRPEPDLLVVAWRDDFYATRSPGPADTLLLIEVADTSLQFDRDVKLPIYARSGVAESWLVDLQNDVIEVHLAPGPGGYTDTRIVRRGDEISAHALPGLRLQVSEVLG